MTLCGRETEIRRIAEDCMVDRLVILTSEPGLGVTGLLEWGVQPALRQQGLITLTYRHWQGKSFVAAFKEAIAAAVREQTGEAFFAQTETLKEMLDRIRLGTRRSVALLLDQFEDYLRCHAGTGLSDSFDAELSHAIAGRSARFVVALQNHSVKPFERFSQCIPNLLGHRLSLAPLTPGAARDAVRAEAARRGMEVEPDVVEALIACQAAAFKDGVHPFFLMRGVARLLDASSLLQSTVVHRATLEGNGGAERLILESLDTAIDELNPTRTELLFRWCNILLSKDRERPSLTRMAVTEKALTDYAGKLNRFVPTTLPLLLQMGLLRSVEMQDAIRYEIARECFTPIVRDWWQRREAFLIARRRAKFRVRSMSIAAGCIVALYAAWLLGALK